MSGYIGDFPTSHANVCDAFGSYAAATGAPSATTNFAAADVVIYRDNSVTQRSSSAGITVTTSFDSITGIQSINIDLSDNTDSGFYAAGHEYFVIVGPITVDGQTLYFPAFSFSIERAGGILALLKATGTIKVDVNKWLSTTVSTPTVAGVPNVNAKTWNDLATVELPLVPTTAGRKLDVSTGGEAGLDWANVGSPTTTVDLSGTTIKTTQKVDVDTIKTNPVVNAGTVTFPTGATLASTTNITAGTVATATNVTTVNGLASGVITATSIAADAITAAKIADGAIDAATFAAGAINAAAIAADAITDAKVASDVTIASVTGAVGSVTGAVGSVTGNVGGNVTGSVGSVASGGITAASIADSAIDRATFAADTGLLAIRSNTAQTGSGTSLTLDASASAVNDFYKNTLVALVSGTGAGQARFITAYNGTTKVATVAAWATNPDNTSVFVITPFDSVPGATAPTAAANATAVWQDLLSGSDFSTSASIGKLLKDDIDAAISSRSSYAGGDTSGTTTLLSRLSSARAGYLDNLSAGAAALESSLQGLITTVGAAGAGLTAADDAVIAAIAALNNLSQASVRTALGLGSANLDTQLGAIAAYIDTEVAAIKAKTDNLPSDPADASDIAASFSSIASTLSTIAGYIDTEVAAIKAKTDNLPAAPAAVGDIPTVGAIADAVFDEASAGHTVSGSYGDKLGAHLKAVLKVVIGTGSTTTSIVLNASTGIDGAAPSAVDDFYNGRVLIFTSGALAGQATSISDYAGAIVTLTVVALTGAPVSGVTAVIA